MATKKKYLYAVQKPSGHEVVSVTVEGATPPVTAQHMENGLVRLVRDGDVLATGSEVIAVDSIAEGDLTLYRWDATDKLAEPTKGALERV